MCLSVGRAPIQTAVDEPMNGLVAYDQPVSIVLDDLNAVTSEASLHRPARWLFQSAPLWLMLIQRYPGFTVTCGASSPGWGDGEPRRG